MHRNQTRLPWSPTNQLYNRDEAQSTQFQYCMRVHSNSSVLLLPPLFKTPLVIVRLDSCRKQIYQLSIGSRFEIKYVQ